MITDDLDRTFAVLPLDSIDPPQLDARIDRDPEKLQELARDIERRGLLLPLIVVRVGARYELVDGFRRYQALRIAGKVAAMCAIYPTKTIATEGAKYGANAYREEMSPVDEAKFFHELFTTECERDLDRVCRVVGKSRNYVDNKLALLSGFEDVLMAVKDRQIPQGVAHALNKVTDDHYRRYFLAHAVKSGATVGMVENWVRDWQTTIGDVQRPAPPAATPAPVTISETYDPMKCYLCRRSDSRFIPEQLSFHTHCKLATLEPLLKALAEGRVRILDETPVE